MSAAAGGGRSLAEGLAPKRLVVLVGEGGVGKTSLSAAIAWSRARSERVAVLTVDPAPRLGDALGIASIDAEPRSVALPVAARGSLTAMRLDTKHTFDRMVERYSPSPASARTLLAHPIYRAVSEQLGGAENYMAFQRLYEISEQDAEDCLVLDTPPAANARELLAAPQRLAGLVDTGALAILAEPARLVARAGSVIARGAASVVLAALERVTGAALQGQVRDFVGLFTSLVGGLEDRARHIDALLRAPTTAFVLVTRPRRQDIETALAFRRDLAGAGIRIHALVVNRALAAPEQSDADRVAALPRRLRDAVARMEADIAALRSAEARALASLREQLSSAGDPPVFVIAARETDLATIEDIAQLARQVETP